MKKIIIGNFPIWNRTMLDRHRTRLQNAIKLFKNDTTNNNDNGRHIS